MQFLYPPEHFDLHFIDQGRFSSKAQADSMQVNFDLFQRQKQMLPLLKDREIDEKHWVVCLVGSILLAITVLKMSKLVCFFPNFNAGGSENFGPQEQFFKMHLRDLFILFRVLTNCSKDIDCFLKFVQSLDFLNISIALQPE